MSRLVVFIVEVLDSLIVDEGVDRFVASLGVRLVHVHTELGSPLRDRNCERGVDENRAESHTSISRSAGVGKHTTDHAELDKGGHHVEHHPLQHKGDPSTSSIQGLAQTTSLPVQVEAQVEVVQVAEHVACNRPDTMLGNLEVAFRTLHDESPRNLRKDGIPQLIEAKGSSSGQTIAWKKSISVAVSFTSGKHAFQSLTYQRCGDHGGGRGLWRGEAQLVCSVQGVERVAKDEGDACVDNLVHEEHETEQQTTQSTLAPTRRPKAPTTLVFTSRLSFGQT